MPSKATSASSSLPLSPISRPAWRRYQEAQDDYAQDSQNIATGLTRPRVKSLARVVQIYGAEPEVTT